MPVDATIGTPLELRVFKERRAGDEFSGSAEVPWELTSVKLVSEDGNEYWFPFRKLFHGAVTEAKSTLQNPVDYIIKVPVMPFVIDCCSLSQIYESGEDCRRSHSRHRS